jgi:hypothetical protein
VNNHSFKGLAIVCLAGGAAMWLSVVHADTTIEQKNTLDVASVIRSHGSTTSSITSDKKRDDSDFHCEGMMSMFCGNMKGGEIVRLDRGLTWRLNPSKKTYTEDVFATPEELALARAKIQERLEKMRSCPASPQQPMDQSKCEMSPPKIDVHKTDDKLAIAGHDTQRSQATLTETCTNKDTGDVCDLVIAIDLWLTQDTVPGAADRRAFQQAYAKRLGLLDETGAMSGEVSKFLAPYQSQIKQLSDKSSDLKGQPLKTSLRVMMGGAQCSAATKAQNSGSTSGGNSAGGTPNPLADVTQAGKAIGNVVGSLFHKKKTDDPGSAAGTPPASATTPGASGTSATADPFAKYMPLATFTTETVSINADTVPADRFEVPPDWKKDTPKPGKPASDDFTCPKTGN